MGLGVSSTGAGELSLDDFLDDLARMYPGFEQTIEDAYEACTGACDRDNRNRDVQTIVRGLPYDEVEPIMRHFLYQLGLGEYLTRVIDSKGRLKISEVSGLLRTAGVHLKLNTPLNLDDWKILLCAWVRRIQEEKEADTNRWLSLMEKMQAEQASKYENALRTYEQTYLDELKAYHKVIDASKKQEESYRLQWESNQEMQDQMVQNQKAYIDRLNQESKFNYAKKLQAMYEKEYYNKIKQAAQQCNSYQVEGAKNSRKFIYPANTLGTGAPISLGAPVPKPCNH